MAVVTSPYHSLTRTSWLRGGWPYQYRDVGFQGRDLRTGIDSVPIAGKTGSSRDLNSVTLYVEEVPI